MKRILSVLITFMIVLVAAHAAYAPLAVTQTTNLSDGYYVINSYSSSGTGFVYTQSGLNTRPFRVDLNVDLTAEVAYDQQKYIWKLTNNEDGSFTLQNLMTDGFVIADSGRNKNMEGSETANLMLDAETYKGHTYIYMTNYNHGGEKLYIHTNYLTGIEPNWSYWNGCSIGGTSIEPTFYQLSEDPNIAWAETEPDVTGNEWPEGAMWYTLQNGAAGFYVSDNGDAAYISLSNVKTELADADL